MTDFTGGIVDFTAVLREEHGFGAGHAATRDALRAAEIVGITGADRLRSAFRAVYCATPDEVARFDAAFDAFFLGARGIAQPNLRSRHTRPDRSTPKHDEKPPAEKPSARSTDQRREDDNGEDARTTAERRPAGDLNDAATTWQALRARYSAAAARGEPPLIEANGIDAMLALASRLVAGVRIARSRRWTPKRTGTRVDLRRTLRASVETAGEPVELRRTARSLRGARFVVLIDGSRSAAEHAGPMLQFAGALAERSRRVNVFVFSTALREVTRQLRDLTRDLHAGERARRLTSLGEAWGGGTRIGDNLAAFAREHGARLLSPETVVLIFSDGLDVGALERLDRAMRELRARSAGVVWLNPHAGAPGFTPSARGMRTALPYLAALAPARDARDFAALVVTLTGRRNGPAHALSRR